MRDLFVTETKSGLDIIYFGYNDSLFYSIPCMQPISDHRPDPATNPDMNCMGDLPENKYAYDPRCRPWYIDTKTTDKIVVLKPYTFFNDNYIGLSICARILDGTYYPNEEFLTIMCEDFNQSTFYTYFQKTATSKNQDSFHQMIFHDDQDTLLFYSETK